MNELATAKIKMMQASIRCLVLGLLGLLPVIGLPFSFAAILASGKARRQEKRLWNAARRYRLVGVTCAWVTLFLWTGVLIFAIGNLLIFIFGPG
jgi:hypothetical protein